MIDTKILNPLDVPTAKPSEIVRNWPDAMWGVDNSKRVAPDGHVTFCAIGILGEMSGFDWGEPDLSAVSGAKVWRGFTYSRVSCFVAEKYHLSPLQLIRVYDQNDLRGKVAAADALESLGLQVATCQSYEILVNPETKVPYKSFCPTELSAAAVRRGGQYCLRHRTNRGGPKPRNFEPMTPDVRDDPEARRYEQTLEEAVQDDMLRKTAKRFSEVTEIVLAVFCLGVILLAVMRDDFDRFILGCACLALTVFFYLNQRWGCVR